MAVKKILVILISLYFMVGATMAAEQINGAATKSPGTAPFVLSIEIDSGITPFIAEYISAAIDAGEREKAAALLIKMDTPGGLLTATRDIVQKMLASKVPIIVYVYPEGARAGSAGVFITLASHVAAMAPSTNIGAAHPVSAGGGDVEGDMKDKVTNDASAWARSIAETRGRNAEWAKKSVEGSESITAIEARDLGVIDIIAASEEELLKKLTGKKIILGEKIITLDFSESKVTPYPMTNKQKFMKFLSDPNLVYILMLLGALGIFIEFQSPGLIIPGLLGVVCLGTVFGVQILPINWFGALLIFLAIAFFVAEIYITSFGLLSVGGLTLLVMGSYLLFSVEGSTIFVEPLLIWLFSGGFALIIVTIGFLLLRAKRQGGTANVDALVGEKAMVTTAVGKEGGKILLHGTYWQAYADQDIAEGEQVEVAKVDGTKIFVVSKKNKDLP